MKKIFLFIAILVLIAGGLFFFFGKNTVISQKDARNLPALVDLPQVFKEIYSFDNDSDGDGLSDAKEIIYGSDPHKPDTDGDGFLDGQEVKAGYDPLVPGKARLEERKDLSLSIQYFTYAQKKTDNPDPRLDSAVIEEFLQEKSLLAFTLPFVAESDIIFANDDPKKIIDYFSFTSKISLPEKGAPFLSLAKDVIQGQSIGTLQETLDNVQATLDSIKKTPVPASLKDIYKDYAGVWMALNDIFGSLQKAQQDPVALFLAQKRGEWLAQEIKRVESERAKLLSDFRLKTLRQESK